MRNKFVFPAIILSSIFTFSSIFANPSDSMNSSHEMPFMHDSGHWLNDASLKLSKDQKDKIKKIFDESKAKTKSAKDDLFEKMKSYQEIYIDEKKSEEDVVKAHNELDSTHKKIMDEHFNVFLQIRPILTSEQRSHLFDMMKDRKSKKHKGHMPHE